MKGNFRSKVLHLANNSKPEPILNIIALVREDEKTREELAENVAFDAGALNL